MVVNKKHLQAIVNSYLSNGTICPKCGYKMWFNSKPLVINKTEDVCFFEQKRKTCPQCKIKMEKLKAPKVIFNKNIATLGHSDTVKNIIYVKSNIPTEDAKGLCIEVIPGLRSPFCIPTNLNDGDQYICILIHEIYHFIFNYPIDVNAMEHEYGTKIAHKSDVPTAIKSTLEGKLHLKLHNLITEMSLKEFNKIQHRWKKIVLSTNHKKISRIQ